MKYISIVLIIILLVACDRTPNDVTFILEASGDNRQELEKVINHYKEIGDEEKLQAAYFLIGNMDNKYWLEGEAISNFDPLFDVLDSIHRNKIVITNSSNMVQKAYDSLISLHGNPSPSKAILMADCQHIKADYLIENIDLAFKIRSETTWGKKLKFADFCEYVLPYRVGHESLEPWRKQILEKYADLVDTIETKNSYVYSDVLNTYVYKNKVVGTNHTFWLYPFDIPLSKMEKGKLGSCKHMVNYMSLVLRAHGIPTGVVTVPGWGNRGNNHDWNVLLTESDTLYPFNAVARKFNVEFYYKVAKVYQETFARQDVDVPMDTKEIPSKFLDNHLIDVTSQYVKTFDITVPLNEIEEEHKYALICTFDDKKWIPQDWGKIEGNNAHFKKIGVDIAYLVQIFQDGKYIPVSNPFILEKNGNVRLIESGKENKQDMVLTRKYPFFYGIINHMNAMVGVRFQGANKPDFSDSVNLFTIKTMPEKLETALIKNNSKFRYVRCISPNNKRNNVAELEFYGGNKSNDSLKLTGRIIGEPTVTYIEDDRPMENAFDGSLETFFFGIEKKKKHGWVGLDLGSRKQITKIRYCPRSDTNFILIGDNYELFYWEVDKWISLGKQISNDQFLEYKNAPSNGLYLLKNLSRGKEERIFTYENGKQIWW